MGKKHRRCTSDCRCQCVGASKSDSDSRHTCSCTLVLFSSHSLHWTHWTGLPAGQWLADIDILSSEFWLLSTSIIKIKHLSFIFLCMNVFLLPPGLLASCAPAACRCSLVRFGPWTFSSIGLQIFPEQWSVTQCPVASVLVLKCLACCYLCSEWDTVLAWSFSQSSTHSLIDLKFLPVFWMKLLTLVLFFAQDSVTRLLSFGQWFSMEPPKQGCEIPGCEAKVVYNPKKDLQLCQVHQADLAALLSQASRAPPVGQGPSQKNLKDYLQELSKPDLLEHLSEFVSKLLGFLNWRSLGAGHCNLDTVTVDIQTVGELSQLPASAYFFWFWRAGQHLSVLMMLISDPTFIFTWFFQFFLSKDWLVTGN